MSDNIFHGPVFMKANVSFDNGTLRIGGDDPSGFTRRHDVSVRLKTIVAIYCAVPADEWNGNTKSTKRPDPDFRTWTFILDEGFKFACHPISELNADVLEDVFAAWRNLGNE